MRKIRTRKEIEKSEKSKRALVGGILVFLMFFSTAGYALLNGGFGGSKKNTENNYDGNYFIYNVLGKQVNLVTPLKSVQDIPVEIEVNLDSYYGQEVYLVGDEDYVLSEIGSNLGKFSGRIQKACYGVCKEDLPEKGCKDNLIVFKRMDEKRVRQEGKCIFIEGDITSADAFLYKLFGI